MPVLKPVRGIRLNKSHPLARGLVGYWLLNEGSGNKVGDLSGNGNTGTFTGTAPSWSAGKFGSAVLLPGTDEHIDLNKNFGFGATTGSPFTLLIWFNTSNTGVAGILIGRYDGTTDLLQMGISTADNLRVAYGHSPFDTIVSTQTVQDGELHCGVFTFSSGGVGNLYLDGVLVGTDASANNAFIDGTELHIGNRGGDNADPLDGLIDHAMIYNRALSASEIALLYREPFCMFDRASWNLKFQISNFKFMAGTSTALSSLSAIAKASLKISGTAAGTSAIDGSLGIMGESPPEMERSWLREALFNGMTANAFKLGTTLSLGWFWVRVTGCSVLYRGESSSLVAHRSSLGVDFTNILVVFNLDTSDGSRATISPPSYIPHNSGSTYFYVVRRFNNCGYQEHTLAAAVKVSIGSNG